MANELDPKRTVLLFFDMQNGVAKKHDPTAPKQYESVISNSVKLLSAARAAGAAVAYTQHYTDKGVFRNRITDTDSHLHPWPAEGPRGPGEVLLPGTWETQIVDELTPQPEDFLIPKYRWNAFYQTCLDMMLRNRGIDTIVIVGGSTDFGVAGTAWAARDLDYNIVVVSDACTSAEQDNHEQLMRRMFPRMGRVRTTDEVVRMFGWAATSRP